MQLRLKIIGVILLFYFGRGADVFATDFVITTNANAGAGSLRQAILDASLNGATAHDNIFFALPGTQVADLTISLTSELPALTSNITIDATTQSGNAFESQNIKIRLLRASASTSFFNGLVLKGVSNIQIYGLFFVNFNADVLAGIIGNKGAIYLESATAITIGKPNMQNAFGDNYAGIYSPTNPQYTLENIKVQSNYFGLLPKGEGKLPNRNGIDISYLKNSVIGGTTSDLGNFFGENENMHINTTGMYGNVQIANNSIGFDIKNEFFLNPRSIGISAGGNDCVLTISDNIIGGQRKGIVVSQLKSFTITRNKIGTQSAVAQNFGNTEVGIEVFKSNLGSINQNDIAYNLDGIFIIDSYPITITKNSMFCNSRFPIRHNTVIMAPIVKSISGTITGTYSPNGIIEVFSNHDCLGRCQGKTFLGSTTALADGTFSYSGSMAGAITVTGTNSDGATSGFTSPILNDLSKQIVDEQCGNGKGSIKNIEVSDATTFTWYTAGGVEVAKTKDLLNVKGGSYYLVAGQSGGCQVQSPLYEIKSIDVAYEAKNVVLTGAACGKTNGSIVITTFNTETPKGFTWLDANDKVVSTDRNLIGFKPGTYRLYGDNGLGCKTLAGTFTIEPTTDLVVNSSKSSIVITDCLKDEGSILNVSISGGTAPLTYQWFDENNLEIGSKPDLIKAPSGTYYLKITDAKGCTVQSDIFTIPTSPLNAKIPDTFSPNGDGINDVWHIAGLEGLSNFEIKIFNRLGTLVFYTKNKAKDFDGKYNNVDLPVGVYYYIIDLKSAACKGLNGSILLIR